MRWAGVGGGIVKGGDGEGEERGGGGSGRGRGSNASDGRQLATVKH